jgi:hypothetical protein
MSELKFVKLYESFLAEAKADVTTTKTIKLNKGIEEKIKLAAELSAQLKKLTKEYTDKITPMQEILNKYDEEILNTLDTVKANQARVEDIIAKVMMAKGRMTDSYKTLWEEALKKVNDTTRKALLEMQAANKKQNPDKYWMEYLKTESTNEGLKDMKQWGSELINKVKTWAKDVWSGIKAAFTDQTKAIDNLEAVANKLPK